MNKSIGEILEGALVAMGKSADQLMQVTKELQKTNIRVEKLERIIKEMGDQ